MLIVNILEILINKAPKLIKKTEFRLKKFSTLKLLQSIETTATFNFH